ncbi:MAG TPA: hypothetical protein VF771_01375 [Longimicrobiaceae bacterium]
MQQPVWEYRVETTRLSLGTMMATSFLNGYGAEGWDLVSAVAPNESEVVLFLKRLAQPITERG